MGFGHFLGEIKAGRGMEAIEKEANRLGVKKIVRGARLGLKTASQILPGKYGKLASEADSMIGKGEEVAETTAKAGSTLERGVNQARSGNLLGAAMSAQSLASQGKAARAKFGK